MPSTEQSYTHVDGSVLESGPSAPTQEASDCSNILVYGVFTEPPAPHPSLVDPTGSCTPNSAYSAAVDTLSAPSTEPRSPGSSVSAMTSSACSPGSSENCSPEDSACTRTTSKTEQASSAHDLRPRELVVRTTLATYQKNPMQWGNVRQRCIPWSAVPQKLMQWSNVQQQPMPSSNVQQQPMPSSNVQQQPMPWSNVQPRFIQWRGVPPQLMQWNVLQQHMPRSNVQQQLMQWSNVQQQQLMVPRACVQAPVKVPSFSEYKTPQGSRGTLEAANRKRPASLVSTTPWKHFDLTKVSVPSKVAKSKGSEKSEAHCTFPGCDGHFTISDLSGYHLATHVGKHYVDARRYACPWCPSCTFITAAGFNSHLKYRHQEKTVRELIDRKGTVWTRRVCELSKTCFRHEYHRKIIESFCEQLEGKEYRDGCFPAAKYGDPSWAVLDEDRASTPAPPPSL